MSFFIPTSDTSVEIVIKNSRFIATLFSCNSREQLKDRYDQLVLLHPKARHHCWAMVCKEPSNSAGYGFSDDGEPSGTAGKPIFNVLSHQNIGQAALIVTRYFGGIKLGTGGLVKAYTRAAKEAIDVAETSLFIPKKRVVCTLPYTQESNFRHFAQHYEADIVSIEYTHHITATLDFALNQYKPFVATLAHENLPITIEESQKNSL